MWAKNEIHSIEQQGSEAWSFTGMFYTKTPLYVGAFSFLDGLFSIWRVQNFEV